ncbi:MAG: hypothetical protein C0429_15940 [Sphingopyxis sp.]|nr:hypothetical protein [Sphingopyxis sp.]
MDPVQIRVAIPAADPPDDITHEILFAPKLAPCALLWNSNVSFPVFLSPTVVHRRRVAAPRDPRRDRRRAGADS